MQQQSVTVNFRNVKNMGLCLYISMNCSLIGCALITKKGFESYQSNLLLIKVQGHFQGFVVTLTQTHQIIPI